MNVGAAWRRVTGAVAVRGTLKERVETARKTGRLRLGAGDARKLDWGDEELRGKLRGLDASDADVEALPGELASFRMLETLVLDGNAKLKELPPEILMKLERLQTLSMEESGVESAPALPPKLKNLNAGRCGFTGVLQSSVLGLGMAPQLVRLSLRGNRITGLGESFGFQVLGSLEELDLSDTLVESVPSDIGACTRLTRLNLERSPVSSLPAELFSKTNLTVLELRGTKLTKAAFVALPGVDAFLARREAAISKAISGGVIVDTSLCGLD